jgi:serine/threonine protein kinase
MAPEQLRGNNVLNRRTDVYAIGILFHRLLTGRFPFDERNREAIVRWHLDEKHQIAKLDHPGLQRVIQRAVAASSDERHASCKEMYRALADAGVLDIDQEDGTPAKPMQNTEAALALTRMIRHFINQDPLKVFFGWEGHYGKVIQQSPDQYELPPTDIAGRRAAVGKTFVPAIMTLSKILSEARTNNERVDSRINENLHVIVTEAEQVIERGIPQTIKLSVGGTALGFLLIVILFFAGGDGLKLGIASLGGVPLLALGIFIGGLLAGHVKRRQFCQDVLRFFGSETKMARFN